MSTLILVLTSTASLCLLFGAVFFLARRIDNYGVVDIAWSYAFGLLALGYGLASKGWAPRRFALVLLVMIWSVRLGTHLWRRVARDHPKEDARYSKFRDTWGLSFIRKMAGFFQLQAISVVLLGTPFLLTAANQTPRFHLLEMLGLLLWLGGVGGEAIADAQLSAFKRRAGSSHPVCQVGLWRYSRHPNYFFEWLIWVGYAVVAFAAPWGIIGAISPLCILWLLLRVTGIPMTEEQSLRSKGDAYRRYQETTAAFIPWFRKSASDAELAKIPHSESK